MFHCIINLWSTEEPNTFPSFYYNSCHAKTYSEPCQKSKPLVYVSFSAKLSILDVLQGYQHANVMDGGYFCCTGEKPYLCSLQLFNIPFR